MGKMQVVGGEGDRFLVDIRGHLVGLDQPVADGGRDTGPTPTELFVASLAGCVAHYARRFLRRHGLPEDVHVDVDWGVAKAPARVGSIRLNVRAPGLPAALMPRFDSVISHCTVHNSMVQAPDVTFEVGSGATRRIEAS